jgi:hypothetical protein
MTEGGPQCEAGKSAGPDGMPGLTRRVFDRGEPRQRPAVDVLFLRDERGLLFHLLGRGDR